MPLPDRKALLCETCGYPLSGLPIDAECPECGRAIEQSLPACRPGSPFQQRSGWNAWLDTVGSVLHRPRETFRRAAIEQRRAPSLVLGSTFAAALLATTPLAAVSATISAQSSDRSDMLSVAIAIIIFFTACWVLLLAATGIESLGIRLFGARRSWRITGQVSLVVVAHASAGWIAGGLIATLGAALSLVAGLIDGDQQVVVVVAFGGLVMGGVVGLLWFESLVYVGVRECKFANARDIDIGVLEGAPQPPESAPVSHRGVDDSARAYDGDASV